MIIRTFHIARRTCARKQQGYGSAPDVPTGCVSRIAHLMALAIRVEYLIRNGIVANQPEFAAFGRNFLGRWS